MWFAWMYSPRCQISLSNETKLFFPVVDFGIMMNRSRSWQLSMKLLWLFWSAQVGWWISMIDGHQINEQINRFCSEMGQCWLHLVYSPFSKESLYRIHTSYSPNWITMFLNRFPPQKYSRLILLFSYCCCCCCCHCCLIAIYLSQKFHIWPVTYEMGIYVYCQLNCRSQSDCVASWSQLNKKKKIVITI